MIDGRNVFDSPIRKDIKTYENIIKIVIGQENYKLIAIHLSKQQVFFVDPKAIHKINVTGNLDQTEGAWIVLILQEVKKSILNFFQRTMRVL